MSALRRGESSNWKYLVVQLGWPQGHLLEPGRPSPPGTQFDVPPLDECSTISEVLNEDRRRHRQKFGRVGIKGKWWGRQCTVDEVRVIVCEGSDALL